MPTLHDGREVASDSEEWRAECEARWVLGLPSAEDRRAWIDSLKGWRRPAAIERLQDRVRAIWQRRRGPAGGT